MTAETLGHSQTRETRDVILRDGTTLRLHPPQAVEADALLGFFSRLSKESLYFRFHGFPSVGPALVAPFLEPDGVERGTLVGTLAEPGGERIVAVAGWTRLRDPRTAEAAFAVEDAMQGRGVGTRLLEQLALSAAAAGIESFVAEVLDVQRQEGQANERDPSLTEIVGGEVALQRHSRIS